MKRVKNLIDLLLRSAHLYQDGGQVLAVLRAALTAVENCRQSEDDPTICEQGGMSRSNTISVCLQYVLNNTVASLRYAFLRVGYLRDASLRVAF